MRKLLALVIKSLLIYLVVLGVFWCANQVTNPLAVQTPQPQAAPQPSTPGDTVVNGSSANDVPLQRTESKPTLEVKKGTTKLQDLLPRSIGDLNEWPPHVAALAIAFLGGPIPTALGIPPLVLRVLRRRVGIDDEQESAGPEAKPQDLLKRAADAEERYRIAHIQMMQAQANNAQLSALNREAADAALNFADQVRRLRECLTREYSYRCFCVLILMISFAFAQSITGIIEAVLRAYAAGWLSNLPTALSYYPQTWMMSISAIGLAWGTARLYQVRTRNRRPMPAAMIGLAGVGGAGLVSVLMTSPQAFQAMSPSGWNVPLGGQAVPLFYFLILTRVAAFPLFAMGGGLIAFATGPRDHDDVQQAKAAAKAAATIGAKMIATKPKGATPSAAARRAKPSVATP
jgi:hypothetical protein